MNYKLLLLLIIIVTIIVLFLIIDYKDPFETKKYDFGDENDGKMIFPFLSDKDNTNTILNTYYLDDDIKYYGVKQNIHPYQKKNKNEYGIPDYYVDANYGTWGKYTNFGKYIYHHYGVRR